jgi:capsular exopolysaccharide synthesis family protein
MVVLLDNKIKTQSMLKEIFDYPVIGEISSLLEKKDNSQNVSLLTDKFKDLDKLFIINKYQSTAAEGIRNIRASLLLKEPSQKNRVISVMSPLQGQGKTSIAINLAVSLSQIEKSVLLIDCDLQSPTISDDLAIDQDCGLVEVIKDSKSFNDCVVNFMQNLDVLCAGQKITYAAEFVQSQQLKSFIDEMSKRYDYIIIDSPSIDVTSDALVISKYTDGSLMVVAAGENDRDSLVLINERLQELKVNIIGVVLNNKKTF